MAGLCPQAQPDDTGVAPTVVTREQITARVLSVRTTYKAKGPSAIAQLTKAILTLCAVVRWRRIWVGAATPPAEASGQSAGPLCRSKLGG
jgi:hypothetical protein